MLEGAYSMIVAPSCCQTVMHAWGTVPLPICTCTFPRRPVVVAHIACACSLCLVFTVVVGMCGLISLCH